MREISVREVTDFPGKYLYEGAVQSKEKVSILYSIYDKSKKTNELYARDLDFKIGNFNGPGYKLLTAEGEMSKYGDRFQLNSSFDSTMFTVRYRLKPEKVNDDKNYDKIGLFVFRYDNGLKLVGGKTHTMPYTEAKMDELGFTVDSRGNTYLLAKVYEGEKKRVKDDEGFVLYTLEMIKFDVATQEMTKSKLVLPERHIASIDLKETNDQQMLAVGYFANGSRKEIGVDGVFFAKVNAAGELTNMKSYEIPLEILNQNATKRELKNNKKKEEKDGKGAQLANLLYDDIEIYPDGSMLIVGEQFHVVVHTVSNGKTTSTYYTYHYDDILATRIAADGSLLWMKRLPKEQRGGAAVGGMSYKLIRTNNSFYFLYLDNLKNLNLPADQDPETHVDGQGGFLTSYKIDDITGKVTKLSIFDMRDVGGIEVFQFSPRRLFQSAPGEFMTEVYKKKKEDILIKITLTEKSKEEKN